MGYVENMCGFFAEHLAQQVTGKLIVPRWHGRVGCEDALLPHCLDVLGCDGGQRVVRSNATQQSENKKGRVALVHVEQSEIGVSQSFKDSDSSDSENRFLTEAVAAIAPIEMASERLIPWAVLSQDCIQKIDGNRMASLARTDIAPDTNADRAPLNKQWDRPILRGK